MICLEAGKERGTLDPVFVSVTGQKQPGRVDRRDEVAPSAGPHPPNTAMYQFTPYGYSLNRNSD